MQVSNAVKAAYNSDFSNKKFIVSFPDDGLTYRNDEIYENSCKLVEMLTSGSSIEFVGCNSSQCECRIYGVPDTVKDHRMLVSVYTDDTEDEPVPLFYGYVKTVKNTSNEGVRKVLAYDRLNGLDDVAVNNWYDRLVFPISIKNFRDGLFGILGMEQNASVLPNDLIMIPQKIDLVAVSALNLIKNLCQINGTFGIADRMGKFDYRFPIKPTEDEGTYPGGLYPGFYPSNTRGGGVRPQVVSVYRKFVYEGFSVKPVDRVTIRMNEDDPGVSYGSGDNNYIIQGNIFTLNQPEEVLLQMARNVYEKVRDFSYIPYEAVNPGLPYLEVGKDAVKYYSWSDDKTVLEPHIFYLLNRTLACGQSMKDTYSAKGQEYQSEFITDLKTQLETVRTQINNNNQRIANMEQKTQEIQKIVSVPAFPDHPQPKTVYIIQGEVVVN